MYLVRYAEDLPDLALLSISTFQKGLKVCFIFFSKQFVIFEDARFFETGSSISISSYFVFFKLALSGPQPADPRQRAASAVLDPRARHCAHHAHRPQAGDAVI